MSARKTIENEFEMPAAGAGDVDAGTEEAGKNAGNTSTPKRGAQNGSRPGAGQPFDPTQYLSKFDGRDYLEVKWRVMWVRHEHPEARMTTEIVQHNEESGFALFRAEVEIPNGGKATGWLAKNAILVTALNPVIGYLNGAAVAKEAMATGKTIKEVGVEKGLLPGFTLVPSGVLAVHRAQEKAKCTYCYAG